MTIVRPVIFLLLLVLITSCKDGNTSKTTTDIDSTIVATTTLSKAEQIINKTILAHGGDLYQTAHYGFTFRDKQYQFKNEGSNYKYTKTYIKDNDTIQDMLTNTTFSRLVNNKEVTLTEKEIVDGSGAINSVIYFAMLPYKLNDPAVNASYIEATSIKNKDYAVIEITFNEAGGGQDFDDQFYYWINKDTNKIDYLAYSYHVNQGGVRFRSAYNGRSIDGITFQDYINYKADVGTALQTLPRLYEADALTRLSEIKTENIINLNKN